MKTATAKKSKLGRPRLNTHDFMNTHKATRMSKPTKEDLKRGVKAAYKLGVMDGEESMMKRLRVMRVAIKRMSEVLKEDPRNYRISSVRLGMLTAKKILHLLQQDDNTHAMDMAQLLNSRITEASAAEEIYKNFNKRELGISR